jgi:NADPH-dependent 2,4-dienoyl-CoA reductase/sulfur reductase-like enzyme
MSSDAVHRTRLNRICIVGASLAGLRAAQALRKHGYDGTLTLVGAERHLPYERPPLSKQVLTGQWAPERAVLASADELVDLGVELRLGRPATGLDIERRRVLVGPETLPYDGLVIATGAHPRQLPIPTPAEGVLTLRTLDDSLALRSAIERPGARVVVIGGGFVGLEVAASCRASGRDVTVLEAQAQPLEAAVGSEIGARCAAWQRDHGVDLRCGVSISRFVGDTRLAAVELSDGTVLDADVAVVGVGADPTTGWLEGSGLTLDRGVVCSAENFAAPDIVAAGDVARWSHPGYTERIRVEHWTNAVEQAECAAVNLLAGLDGAPGTYAPTPYFWSDQFGKRLQFAGRIVPGCRVHLETRASAGEFVALFTDGDRLSGAFALGVPRDFIRLRRLVVDGGTTDEARRLLSA